MFEIDDEYIREVNSAYRAEEEEMKMGIHPSQIFERVQHTLKESGCDGEITFMDYSIPGSRVIVSVNNSVYGAFDYEDNIFLSTPDERLNDMLEANGFGLYER